MKYNLKNEQDKFKFELRTKDMILRGVTVELTEPRTNKTNSALHLYFTFIADALNELGQEFCYDGVVKKGISTKYNAHIVKEFFWRPLQIHVLKVESTKDLENSQLNELIEIVNKFFAEKGVDVVFPSIESLIERNEMQNL